jgi:outer membrane beta-barrel protein
MKDIHEPKEGNTGSSRDTSSRDTKVKLGIVLVAALWLLIVAMSWAEAAEPPAASADDEYSFNWLDPDKKIYVLQNRRYLKVGKPLLSVMVGPGLSNSYRNVFNVEPRFAYYFSELLGIEVFYTNSFNKANNTVEALQRATATTLAVVREIRTQMGVLVHYVPWYAKINVFNKILYFDWYLAGGAGTVKSALLNSGTASAAASTTPVLQQDSMAFFLGTGHQFHLSEQVVFRLDFTGAFYNAQIDTTNGDKAWYSNFNFGTGLGLRF